LRRFETFPQTRGGGDDDGADVIKSRQSARARCNNERLRAIAWYGVKCIIMADPDLGLWTPLGRGRFSKVPRDCGVGEDILHI